MIGPAIGGLLIAGGGLVLAFVLNAATFAVIAVVLWRLPSPQRGPRARGTPGEASSPASLAAAAADATRDQAARTRSAACASPSWVSP